MFLLGPQVLVLFGQFRGCGLSGGRKSLKDATLSFLSALCRGLRNESSAVGAAVSAACYLFPDVMNFSLQNPKHKQTLKEVVLVLSFTAAREM